MSLGPAIKPDPAPPEPEWKPHPTKKHLVVNAKGQLRTSIPGNEAVNFPPYGWPNWPLAQPKGTP